MSSVSEHADVPRAHLVRILSLYLLALSLGSLLDDCDRAVVQVHTVLVRFEHVQEWIVCGHSMRHAYHYPRFIQLFEQ